MAQKKKDNIILLVCAVVFVLALVAMIGKWYSEKKAQEKYESMSQMSTEMKIGDEIDVFSDLGIDNPGKVLDWMHYGQKMKIYMHGFIFQIPILTIQYYSMRQTILTI